MASALEKLMKGTLQKSDAQKAFSTFWETVEDKMLYSIMILGMIALPFNMVSNTPVECTLDQNHESFQNLSAVDRSPMRYHHFYLRKFCTMNYISQSMVFLPFVLILAPLPLVGIGQMCLRFYKVQRKMNSFYKLLVKDSLDREDVEALEKENLKNSHEVIQMFEDSCGIYKSYRSKAFIQTFIGICLTTFLFWIRLWALSGKDITCIVFKQHYVCVVPLAAFYTIILNLALGSTIIYVLSSTYSLLWILIPRFSPFHRFMKLSKDYVALCIADGVEDFTNIDDEPDKFFDIYFNKESPDLGLLITLLANRNGPAEGLRFVSLFDEHYKQLWKVTNGMARFDDGGNKVAYVEWDDAPLASFVHNFRGRIQKLRVEYTIEIDPPLEEDCLKSQKYFNKTDSFDNDSKDEEEIILRNSGSKKLKKGDRKYEICFQSYKNKNRRPVLKHQPFSVHTLDGNIYFSSIEETDDKTKKKTINYKVIISSEVNGRTIAQETLNLVYVDSKI